MAGHEWRSQGFTDTCIWCGRVATPGFGSVGVDDEVCLKRPVDGSVDITKPVKMRRSRVYYLIEDAEDRLIAFLGLSEKDKLRAELIVSLINGPNDNHERQVPLNET